MFHCEDTILNIQAPSLHPRHVKAFYVMVEMALFQSFSGDLFRKYQIALECTANDWTNLLMPVGCVSDLAVKFLSLDTVENRKVRFPVFVLSTCEY